MIQILKKISLRLLIVTLIFIGVNFTNGAGEDRPFLCITTIFYYVSAVVFFLASWEINDRLIAKHLLIDLSKGLDWKSGLLILGKTMLIIIPFISTVYYLAFFEFSQVLEIETQNPFSQLVSDLLRAVLLLVTVCLFNLFYHAGKAKTKLEQEMSDLQKELITSKYKSLKSQISPHFLFNSLNTLTGLMYEDRDLASDFTSRLASCYRYILENRDKDLVGLDKELSFLDSFIFMMNVRHRMSLNIRIDIKLNPTKYVIPTLALQMLLENALKHNYFSNEKPLLITIENDKTSITMTNTLRERRDPEKSTHLGLENIKKRFMFYTSQPLEVNRENDVFSVRLPLLRVGIDQKPSLQIVS